MSELALERLLAPFAGAAPTGSDPRGEPAHDALRAELDKLTSVHGALPDWALVAHHASALLGERAKDLAAAGALACALLEREGVAGLTTGLALLTQLIARYGDALFPQRARARANALDWLYERAADRLASAEATPDAVASLRAAAVALGEAARGLLGDAAPASAKLDASIARLSLASPRGDVATKSVASEPARAPDPPPPVRQDGPTLPRAPDAPRDGENVVAFAKASGEALVEAARTLAELDRTAPAAYRLLRTGLWLHLDRAPPAEGGRTRIPAPDARARASLEALLAHEQWAQALVQSEALLRRSPLWLDPHRLTVRAMSALGASYDDAQRSVIAEARALVTRMPGLVALTFADGTPLATPETVALLAPPEPSAAARPLPTMGEDQPSLAPALQEGLARAEPSALAAWAAAVERASSLRARFRLRLALAHALLEGKRLEPALAILLALEGDLDVHGLESWEPALAIELLVTLRRALEAAIAAKKAEPAELRRIWSRLARLAPTTLV